MKKTITVILGVVALVAIILGGLPRTRDEIYWQWSSYWNNAENYESYLSARPDGLHATEARRLCEERMWAEAKDASRVLAFERYLKKYPDGTHAAEAKDRIGSLELQRIKSLNTIRALDRYLETHPDSLYTAQVNERIESLHWREATDANTVSGFENYLRLYPDGRYVGKASDNIESLRWQDATAANTVSGLENYLRLYPDGRYVGEASDNIESLHWREASEGNTARTVGVYLDKYPAGRYVQKARLKQAALLADDTPFLAAREKDTEGAFIQFLLDFPGHRREPDARAALKEFEGRGIVELLEEKRIEIESSGSDIQNVKVRVRRLIPQRVTIRIPVGTYFVSRDPSSQNMVATKEVKRTLDSDDWTDLSVAVACANRGRDIPGSHDSFTVQQCPDQPELARLMPALDKVVAPYAVRQAAVWIVTDDADYDDLGRLEDALQTLIDVSGRRFGQRVINEYEAAQGIRMCDEAGIDVTRKKIWRDRQRILSGLQDDTLKKWLAERK